MKGSRIKATALDLLFPRRCPFCRAVIPLGEDMCAPCAKALPRTVYRRFAVGGVRCCAPLPYEGAYAAAVKRFKFGKQSGYAHALARLTAQAAARSYDLQTVDMITCVPEYRKAHRRFRHAEVLARSCAEQTGIPYADVLEKHRKNLPQHTLRLTMRAENVRGVYRVIDAAHVRGKRILLIDDIITSGNTLGECARMLRKSGCREVLCAAVCTTLNY